MTATIYIVPGFSTNPEGDCLGLRPYAQSLAAILPNLKIVSIAWNKLYPNWFADNRPSPPAHDDINILFSHSYGCAACKRALDKSFPNINLAVWFDPVPRFWWWQFRFGPRWSFPITSDRNIQFYQYIDPWIDGYPFKEVIGRDLGYDVSKLGLHHSDVPGNSAVLRCLTSKIISQFSLAIPVGQNYNTLNMIPDGD